MKVLMIGHLADYVASGGLESHNLNVLNHLRGISDLNIEFRTSRHTKRVLAGRGNLWTRISWFFPIGDFLSFSAFAKKFKPDIIHVQGCGMSPYAFFFILSPFQSKKVVTVHGIPSQEAEVATNAKFTKGMVLLSKIIEKAVFRRADAIILVDKRKEKWLYENQNPDISQKSHVIQNGVDVAMIERVRSMIGLRDDIRKKLNVPSDFFLILHAKGFFPYNGQEFLIRAMVELRKKRKDVMLVLAGDGPLREEMMNLCRHLGVSECVIFLGWRKV
jgi:glycosyltransferase involved in cell wall biosynthesis